MEYVRGLRLARRAQSTGRAVVLAYHAIRDLRGDVLSAYGVPPARLAAQLDWLRRSGWRFVALEDLLRALEGTGRLPRRAIMLTFDDAYTDLLESACPILAARGIPAVTFAVGELIGGCNDWRPGASRPLPLLDEAGLRQVASRGIAVGSHAATHRPLVAVGEDELYRELRGSAARLEAAGLPRPQVLAYPHGEWSPAVAAAVHSAGYAAAFTVTPGVVERGENRYALPRVEVYADDSRVTVWLKVLSAGWPHPLRRRILERLPGPGRRRRR
jgi:peptidoglycan/xylan/chitin deacetylase (PgdA/CDA1 family)